MQHLRLRRRAPGCIWRCSRPSCPSCLDARLDVALVGTPQARYGQVHEQVAGDGALAREQGGMGRQVGCRQRRGALRRVPDDQVVADQGKDVAMSLSPARWDWAGVAALLPLLDGAFAGDRILEVGQEFLLAFTGTIEEGRRRRAQAPS
ncbi:hypothetical protein HS125_06605 [bacterium]|nr:hypothetical protein [bacterium]